MIKAIQREILIPQPREQVWRAITDSATLAEWMFPNDFEPRVGHHFTFRVPGNPKMNFDGLTVRCEVLECEPPHENARGRLAFSWSAPFWPPPAQCPAGLPAPPDNLFSSRK